MNHLVVCAENFENGANCSSSESRDETASEFLLFPALGFIRAG